MLKVKIKIRGVLLRDKARLYACTALAAKTVVLPDPKHHVLFAQDLLSI